MLDDGTFAAGVLAMMSIEMFGGLFGLVAMAAVVVGCSGGALAPVDQGSQDDTQQPSQAKLPKKTESTPSKSDAPSGGTQTPSGTQAPSGTNGQPGQPGQQPGKPGQPGGEPGQPGGEPGQNGVCCYNNQAYDCPDTKSCLGGYDLDACQAACAEDDFNCQIACVNKLSDVKGPTAACKPAGKCGN
jgi:hypothetical protein